MSVACAKRSLDLRAPISEEYSAPVFKGTLANLWRPVLGTAILAFMSGLMLQLSARQDIPLETFQTTSLVTQAVLMAALFLPVLLVKKQPNLGAVYKVALPLSAAGFLLLPLIWDGAGGLANACAQLGTLVAGIILWCMAAEAVHDTKLPAVLLFSCTFLCTNAAQLAGMLVGFFNASTLAQGDVALTAVALVAVYLVAMVSMFLFKDRKLNAKEDEVAAAPQQGDALEARCNALAKGMASRHAKRRYWCFWGKAARRGASREALRFRKHGEVPHQVHLPEARRARARRSDRPHRKVGSVRLLVGPVRKRWRRKSSACARACARGARPPAALSRLPWKRGRASRLGRPRKTNRNLKPWLNYCDSSLRGGGASWPIMTSCVPFLFALGLRALAQCETPRLAQGGLTGVGWEDAIATAGRPRHVSL